MFELPPHKSDACAKGVVLVWQVSGFGIHLPTGPRRGQQHFELSVTSLLLINVADLELALATCVVIPKGDNSYVLYMENVVIDLVANLAWKSE
jgi:hypothetical protein